MKHSDYYAHHDDRGGAFVPQATPVVLQPGTAFMNPYQGLHPAHYGVYNARQVGAPDPREQQAREQRRGAADIAVGGYL